MSRRSGALLLVSVAAFICAYTVWLSYKDFKNQYWEDGKFSTSEFTVVKLGLELDRPLFETDDRFLSVNIDWAQIVGAPWWDPSGAREWKPTLKLARKIDFTSEKLKQLTQALGPLIIRVGGSSGDDVGYDEKTSAPYRLTQERWGEIRSFAQSVKARLLVGLNGGPSSRDTNGAWRPESAAALLDEFKKNPDEVEGVELGNEANAYAFRYGFSNFIKASQWISDLKSLRSELQHRNISTKIMGPSSAFWPVLHEPFSWLFGLFKPLADQKGLLDVLTWHYYPTQSMRCSVNVRRTTPFFSTNAERLDEWQKQERLLESYRAGRPIWLGETGPAQCGGQPGVSDRFVSSLWWVDQLGLAAKNGQAVVVRQSLTDLDYGFLSGEAYEPRPDYWASLAWRNIMGSRVIAVRRGDWAVNLRAYAHCLSKRNPLYRPGAIAIVVLNLFQNQTQKIDLVEKVPGPVWSYSFSALSPFSNEVLLNGQTLKAEVSGRVSLPAPLPVLRRADLLLDAPPLSFTFLAFPQAQVRACF